MIKNLSLFHLQRSLHEKLEITPGTYASAIPGPGAGLRGGWSRVRVPANGSHQLVLFPADGDRRGLCPRQRECFQRILRLQDGSGHTHPANAVQRWERDPAGAPRIGEKYTFPLLDILGDREPDRPVFHVGVGLVGVAARDYGLGPALRVYRLDGVPARPVPARPRPRLRPADG